MGGCVVGPVRGRAFIVATLLALVLGMMAPGAFWAPTASAQSTETLAQSTETLAQGTETLAQGTEAADAEIDVELLVQSVQPFQPLLVRLTVRAERAISGQLELVPEMNEWSNPIRVDNEYRWDIDVAANTEVQTLALMPVGWDTNALEARLTAGEEVIATQKKSINVGMVNESEQIGTFGVDSPARVNLIGAPRGASVTKLDGLELVGPALGSFSTIVADSTALAGLDDSQREIISGWVMDGGQLALPNGIDDLAAAGLGELEAFRTGPLVGQGVVVGFGDAVQLSDDVLLSNGPGANAQRFGPMMWSDPVASLGQRSGLQLASIRSLAIFLGFYALVAGPIAYAVAQRLRRPRLLWVILPITALAFTGVAALTGSMVRNAGHDEHTTVVMSRPNGSQAESYLLVRGGEDISVDGDWWVAATQSEMIQQGPGALRFDVGPEMTTASVQVASGSAALLTATGPDAKSDAGLQLTVLTNDPKTITGTVTNNLTVDLHDAIVIWEGGSADIDSLPAGQSKEFSIEYKERPSNQWGGSMPGPEQTKWGMVNGFQGGGMVAMGNGGFMNGPVVFDDDNGIGEPREGSMADGNIWTLWIADHPTIFSRSQLVAIGWTDQLPSPTASVGSGRTAFVSTVPVKSEDVPAFRSVDLNGNEFFMEQDMAVGAEPVFEARQRVDFAEPIVAADWSVALSRSAAGLSFDIDGEQRWVAFETDDDGALTVKLPEELDGATSIFLSTAYSMNGPMGASDTEATLMYRDPEALSRKIGSNDEPTYREVPFTEFDGMGMARETADPIEVPALTIDEPYTDSGVTEPGIANLYVIDLLNKNTDITVEMSATNDSVDPMLTLRNSDGATVASNDDVRGSTDSSINFAGADPGRYEILAESIGAPGPYEITITLNDPGEAVDTAEGGSGSTEPVQASVATPTPIPEPTESVDG